jgi:transcriptional regulator with XRE-family HTH domain
MPGDARQLGSYIRELRKQRGCSVRRLADEAGVAPTWLFRVEEGDYLSPAPDRLQRLAEAFAVDFEDLYALAGYDRPERLPSFGPYLRSKYDDLPEDILADVERYFRERTGGTS